MKAETIIYRNKFLFALKWEKVAIADYVRRSVQSGFSMSVNETNEFRSEFLWEWNRVIEELEINDRKKIALSIIAIDQIINNTGVENYACKPGLN